MPTLTIRNIPEPVVRRLKASATSHKISMEQEVRNLLARRYAAKRDVLSRVRERWESVPATSDAEAQSWRKEGRKG